MTDDIDPLKGPIHPNDKKQADLLARYNAAQKFEKEQLEKKEKHIEEKDGEKIIGTIKAIESGSHIIKLSAADRQELKDHFIHQIALGNMTVGRISEEVIDDFILNRNEENEQKQIEKEQVAKLKDPPVEQQKQSLSEQPPPDNKQDDAALIAERLAQKARMNNADMDRLASFGPKHANYQPLKADQIQQRFGNPELMAKYHQDEQNRTDAKKAASPQKSASSDVTASSKRDIGLMADFVTAKTKKEDAEQAIQQQWQAAANAKGMTRR